MKGLKKTHKNAFHTAEPNLLGVGTTPRFAIGQRAMLVQTPGGNVLWDCITLLDEATRQIVRALGGLEAIAISHPHFYSAMVEWAHAFDAPIILHESNQEYVMCPDDSIQYWEGNTYTLGEGLTLIQLGGHFPGGTVLHWADGAEGRGALLSGDIIHVVSDRRYVSFMYSYPNYIPLPASTVQAIADAIEPYAFERIYGAWWDQVVAEDGKNVVRRSARRYIEAITG
jgi:glyoxylase-like metal-dependent hydrolase (beta-lactamase superfamily II)